MKFIAIGFLLIAFAFVGFFADDFVFAQTPNRILKVSYVDNVAPAYEAPLPSGKKFTLIQSYSWVNDETSRYSLVSYTLDGGEPVKIARDARGDFSLSIPTDSSHDLVFTAVLQHALVIEGTNDFAYLPTSPTQDNWFDKGTDVAVNVLKTTEVEPNKVRQEITGWSLDKAEFWEIEDDGMASFTTPPITMDTYHQIDFFKTYQYKLNVVSDSGTTTGSGWYAQGETVPIGVDAGGDGLVLNSLSEWEGADVQYDGNTAQVYIDGPVTVTAKLEENYSLLIAVIIIPILVGGIVAGKKIKRTPAAPVIVEKTIEKTVEAPKKNYTDKYDEKLSVFLSQQIQKKLEEMNSSEILSDSKFSKIKES